MNWKDRNIEYNPIRNHIKLDFEVVRDTQDMAGVIIRDLKARNFEESKSRVLIFIRTRKQSEEIAASINDYVAKENLSYKGKADFYHAGLEGTDRAEKSEKFKEKDGGIIILVATKAFGMGMDIENIHFVFHVGPSSTFEDFLQEVGRVGRNEQSYKNAGFSKSNPLLAKSLITNNDFNKIKDLQHKNEITWAQLEGIRQTIFSYISQFREVKVEKENAFPIPLDLLGQDPDYEEVYNKETVFRVVLYWLEKLNRIKLGVYTPSHLPIEILKEDTNFANTNSLKENEQLRLLMHLLWRIQKERFVGSAHIMADMQFIKDSLKITSTIKLFRLLFVAQRFKLLILKRNINLEITNNRTPEIKGWKGSIKSPRIDATFEFATEILKSTIPGSQIALDNQDLQYYIKEVVITNFLPENIFWKERKKNNDPKTKEHIAEELIKDFENTRKKFAFRLINFLPKLRHKSHIEYEHEKAFISQLVYNAHSSNEIPLRELRTFKLDLIKLIKYIAKENLKNAKYTFNIVQLINELDLNERGGDYLQKLVFISKGLGYLKGEGGDLVPMGIELFIQDLSPINEENEKDLAINIEFEESNKMKELRLLALKCLTGLKDGEHDTFIKRYFKCSGLNDVLKLLNEYLGEDHADMKAYQEEALINAKKALNENQRKVYNTNLNKNLQVIAGPGTGKTHTLILRVARLIQEDKISPESILILAYNRAVVVELKQRLNDLFRKLGYLQLIKRLKVFTFHGFMKYTIGSELEGLEFKHWASRFITIMENSPGTISQRLGPVKYVFVDEFQDITRERMKLLQFIANPNRTSICVIGDPNQSIYGYERMDAGDTMDPRPYYEDFKNIYNPIELNLEINYRSYREILVESERLLELNDSRFRMPALLAHTKPIALDSSPVEIFNYNETRLDWKIKLQELLDFGGEKEKYQQIAVMFRSNNEVYRAFNILQDLNLNVRLRVQGAKGSLIITREFFELLSRLKVKSDVILQSDFLQEISELKLEIISNNPNWDEYILNVFHCIAYEFEKEKNDDSTYSDLIQFIEDIGRRDDGQFGKIYEQNIESIGEKQEHQEIVITTMHKVKGLEFDAVLIPPSFSNLPTSHSIDEETLIDYIEEERRLYYVAYSRAKRKLVAIKYEREEALADGNRYVVPVNVLTHLGLAVAEGIDKLTLYWSASNYGQGSFEFIKNNVSIGDAIVLRPIVNEHGAFWYAYKGNQRIASLSLAFSNRINHLSIVNGFIVSSVYVHTYEETLRSDEKNNTNYADRWNDASKERGYVYLIDFSGYGK